MPDQPAPTADDLPRDAIQALIDRVGNAVIDLLPPEWDEAVLEVTVDRAGPTHAISHPRRRGSWVAPSIALSRLTEEPLALFARHGKPWTRAKVEVIRTADGVWDYAADFGLD